MKVKNRFFESGMEEMGKLSGMDLPANVSFQIVKGLKKLDETSKFYFETKQKLMQKYGELTEDSKAFTFSKENLPIFQKELNDLLEVENEIPFDKVKLPSNTKVSPRFLLVLEQFVEVE